MKTHRVVGLAVCLASLTSAALAEPLGVAAGTRIRVTVSGQDGSKVRTGTVLANQRDALVISTWRHTSLTIPVADVEKLEVRTGGYSRGEGFARGVGIGALVGAGLGALLGASSTDGGSSGDNAAIGAIALGIVGIPIGGLVGLASGGERYTEVPTASPDVAVGIAPARNRVMLQAAYRF